LAFGEQVSSQSTRYHRVVHAAEYFQRVLAPAAVRFYGVATVEAGKTLNVTTQFLE